MALSRKEVAPRAGAWIETDRPKLSIPAPVGAANTGENGSWVNEITPAGARTMAG